MKIRGAVAASLLTLCWAGTSVAETIKVGVVLPYSGPNADLGIQVDRAYDLYLKLHAKDMGYHKIELIKRDEGPASGANARTVVTELITNDKVKLLAGFVFSPGAIAGEMLTIINQQIKLSIFLDCHKKYGEIVFITCHSSSS